MSPQALRGVLLALSSALGSALFLLPYKAAGALAPTPAVLFATLAVAALLNTLLSLSGGLHAWRMGRAAWVTALVFAVLTATGNMGTSEALARVDAGVVSVAQQTQILFVAVGAWLFLRERITVRYLVGAAIVLSGFVLIHEPGASGAAVSIIGILWAVESALSFAIMQVITRKEIHRIAPLPVNAVRLWLGAALAALVPGSASAALDMPPLAWLWCATAAFVGPFISRIFLMYALRYISASHAILLNLIAPIFAFILDYMLFGSVPSGSDILGSLVIVVGICLPVLELVGSARPPVPVPVVPEPVVPVPVVPEPVVLDAPAAMVAQLRSGSEDHRVSSADN